MKICIGLNKKDEILPLIRAGADEFYSGVIPRRWRSKYGHSFLSRRENSNSNFLSFKALAEAINLVHQYGKKIFITFNSLFYPQVLYPDLEQVLAQVIKLRPDGLIIADLGLLLFLQEKGFKIDIILSGEFGIFNSYAMKSIQGIDSIKRITIQRHVDCREIGRIAAKYPNYEYEAFVLNEKCPFVGSHCFASHGDICLHKQSGTNENFCSNLIDSELSVIFSQKKSFSYLNKALENCFSYHKREKFGFLSSLKNRELTQSDIPVNCGLCYVESLKRSGVRYLKIVGRGRPLKLKLMMVSLLRRVIDNKPGREKIKSMYARVFKEHYPEACEAGYFCYY